MNGYRKIVFALALLPVLVYLAHTKALVGPDLANVLMALIALFSVANGIEHWSQSRKAVAESKALAARETAKIENQGSVI